MDESFDNYPLLHMRPIGLMESCFKYKNGTPRQPGLVSAARGKLTISRNLYSSPEHSLEGLEEFSHVWILFSFHKNNNAYSKAKVKPPRLNGRKVGVFSTRSPYRPNAVGLTLAKIESIQGASILLSGIDLLDGTPVLDLKPYIAAYDQPRQVVASVTSAEKCMAPPSETDNCDAGLDSLCSSQQTRKQLPDDRKPIQDGCQSPEKEDICNKGSQETCLSLENEDVFGGKSSHPNTCDIGNTCCDTDVNENACDDMRCGSDILSTNEDVISEHCNIENDADTSKHRTTQSIEGAGLSNSLESMKVSELESGTAISPSGEMVEDSGCDLTPQDATTSSASSSQVAAHIPVSKEPPAESRSGGIGDTSTSASWIKQPPIARLSVEFTEKANQQMFKFSHNSSDLLYQLTFLDSPAAVKKSICDILQADPRSTYRRTKCMDRLYFFIVDNCHVTCWFDETTAQVVRVQPAAFGHPELGLKRAKQETQ